MSNDGHETMTVASPQPAGTLEGTRPPFFPLTPMPIAKVTQGNSAFRCLNYVMTKDKAELLDTNCAADTPQNLAQEFAVAFQPHYRNGADRHTEDYVAHFSISFHTDLPKPQLEAIAYRFMELMGFDPVMNQFVLAKHNDTDDCHIHLIENRIRLDGQVVSDSFQQRRTEVAMRTLEEEFDLPRLKNSWAVDVRAPKVAEVRQSRESGKPIPRRVLQETIERCGVGAGTLAELQQKLQESHVTLNATLRDDGSWALLYRLALEGERVRTFSATKLGRRYTKRGLQSTFGLSFGDEGVANETVETVAPPVPLVVLPDPPVAAVTGLVTGLETPNTYPEGFGQKPLESATGSESFWQEPLEAVAPQAENDTQKHPESVVETDSFEPELLESATHPTEGEGFWQELVEPSVMVEGFATETDATPDLALTTTSESEGFWQKRNGSNTEPEGSWVESGHVSETREGFRQALPESLATPETQAERFRQKLEQLAAQLASTQAPEWTDALTPTQAMTRTESLKAVLQWTQSHIDTLELRAIGIGLENASDQARWDTLSAQAQQKGLTDLQQIESAVTALACRQGYKTKTIVKLLQQSPRVKKALGQHDFKTVEQALTQNVVQVRQELRQRQKEALKRQQQKGCPGER